MQKRHNASTKASEASIQEMEIPEEEQWRLINESGILTEVPLVRPEGGHRVEEKEEAPEEESFAEEVFDAILYIVPFSFCLLLMEMCASMSSTWNVCLIASKPDPPTIRTGRKC